MKAKHLVLEVDGNDKSPSTSKKWFKGKRPGNLDFGHQKE